MFDDQPVLIGETLRLRPLESSDFEALYFAANDPATWAGHPVKDRHERNVFETYFKFLIDAGGTLLVIDEKAKTAIGCSRYYASPDVPDMISIGFTFINSKYWGGNTNAELKSLMLTHAFATYVEVWFHIDPTNIRSQKATAKLGAECVTDRELNLGGKPAQWKCWRLRKSDWIKSKIT